MADLEKEIANAQARLERLKVKQREAEAKKRARFGAALVAVIDEIGEDSEVTVRELSKRAWARIKKQDKARSDAARSAAATRAAAAKSVDNVSETEQRAELNEATDSDSVWRNYRVAE